MTLALGVDGFGARWVVAAVDGDQLADVWVVERLDELPTAQIVGVDMFVALGRSGPRQVDRWCRREVGKLSSSVFNAPPRRIVTDSSLHTYDEVRAALDPSWPGISRQTWGLIPKIREVRALALARPGRVFECHPEVCFARLSGSALSHRKRTWAGQRRRFEILDAAGIDLSAAELPGVADCPVDDVLDAIVVAHVAAGYLSGRSALLPRGAGARVLAPA